MTIAPAPAWLVEYIVSLKTQANEEKLVAALQQLSANGSLAHFAVGPQSNRFKICGATELQLDTALLKLQRVLNIAVGARTLQVAYREKLRRKIQIDYTHNKHIGSMWQRARVVIDFSSNDPGSGNQFESKVLGDEFLKHYNRSVRQGVHSAVEIGGPYGFPIVDLKATLIDATADPIESSMQAFEIAAHAATREALQKGRCELLEPIMKVEVTTPEEYSGFVIGDLNSRRGVVRSEPHRDNRLAIVALAPLANMFGYVNQLRSDTQGRAEYEMQFDHYAAVPNPSDGGDDPTFRPAMGMRA
jgi:elongation factor G